MTIRPLRHWLTTCAALLVTLSLAPGLGMATGEDAATPRLCDLSRITDGDTVRLKCDDEYVTVRLYCIDAPEMAQRPWGTGARRALERLTPREVQLRPITLDRFGRTVGAIHDPVENVSLGVELVRGGHVAVYPKYCTDPLYLEAEALAKAANLGIWSMNGDQQTPWEFRH
jgi:endonuclease YncB( thermonuclease family)